MAVRWIFCLHYINGRIGDEETKGVELIGYDTPRQAYFTPFFDNQGSAGFEELRADGNTWTWLGKNVGALFITGAWPLLSDDGGEFDARHEQSNDGEHWRPWMNVTLTREA
jgi:hypothetical protein